MPASSASRAADKKLRRAEREQELGLKIRRAHADALAVSKRYGLILADPPWRYDVFSRETGLDRAADNHYPTARTWDIAALPIAQLAADDCVLFLWRTAPMLLAAMNVMARWGFVYRSELIWAKDRIGTGHWFRNAHEVCMVGTRGHPVAPAPGTQSRSVLPAPVRGHSVKPDEVHEMIERIWPNTPKLELFARRRRPGWDVAYSPEADLMAA